MTCQYWIKRWNDTRLASKKLRDAHSTVVGDEEEGPRFYRVEAWLEAEPSRDIFFFENVIVEPACACGEGGSWRHYWHTTRVVLLKHDEATNSGGEFVAFPDDPKINRRILEEARNFYPWHGSAPGEAARDMCQHLAEKGVRRNVDGTYDYRFISQEALTYARKFLADVSVNQHVLKKGPTNE